MTRKREALTSSEEREREGKRRKREKERVLYREGSGNFLEGVNC